MNDDTYNVWASLGDDDPKRLRAALAQVDDRILTLCYIFESFAVLEALHSETPVTEQELAIALEIAEERVSEILHGTFQSDQPWATAEQTATGETWLWRRAISDEEAEWNIAAAREDGGAYDSQAKRKKAAFQLLKKMNLSSFKTREEAAGESPSDALRVGLSAIWSLDRKRFFEDGILSVLHKPRPVWAGAVGFTQCYEACLERSRTAKQLGESNIDSLTRMHCYAAAGMWETSGVLVTSTEQQMALPLIPKEEQNDFLRRMELPLRPYFIDFTGSPGNLHVNQPLPTMKSYVAQEEHVGFVGCHLDQHNWAEGVLLITPFVLYNIGLAGGGLSTLGMVAVNQTDDPCHIFNWGDDEYMFDPNTRLIGLTPRSDYTDANPELLPEYERLMLYGATMAVKTLYMLDSANVSTVPRPLERRDRKRAEKRGWNVADVVYVHRTKRRYSGEGVGTGEEIAYTHQFDVSAHFRHFTKGPHVRCRACQGKTLDSLICPECKGTGLDPEKVAPCSRIDEATGELTCPNGCRREFVPTYVKGPTDAPYVPKVRKLVN